MALTTRGAGGPAGGSASLVPYGGPTGDPELELEAMSDEPLAGLPFGTTGGTPTRAVVPSEYPDYPYETPNELQVQEGLNVLTAQLEQLVGRQEAFRAETERIAAQYQSAEQAAYRWRIIAQENQNEIERLTRQYDITSGEYRVAQQELDNLRRAQGGATTELQLNRQQLDQLRNQYAQASADLESVRRQLEQRDRQFTEAQQAEAGWRTEMDALRVRQARADSNFAAVSERIRDLSDQLQRSFGTLDESLSILRTQIDAIPPTAGPDTLTTAIKDNARAAFNLFALADATVLGTSIVGNLYQASDEAFDRFVDAAVLSAARLHNPDGRLVRLSRNVRGALRSHYLTYFDSMWIMSHASEWLANAGLQRQIPARDAVTGATANVRALNSDAVFKAWFVALVIRYLFLVLADVVSNSGTGQPVTWEEQVERIRELGRIMGSNRARLRSSIQDPTTRAFTFLLETFAYNFRFDVREMDAIRDFVQRYRPDLTTAVYRSICRAAEDTGILSFSGPANAACTEPTPRNIEALSSVLIAPLPPWSTETVGEATGTESALVTQRQRQRARTTGALATTTGPDLEEAFLGPDEAAEEAEQEALEYPVQPPRLIAQPTQRSPLAITGRSPLRAITAPAPAPLSTALVPAAPRTIVPAGSAQPLQAIVPASQALVPTRQPSPQQRGIQRRRVPEEEQMEEEEEEEELPGPRTTRRRLG